MDNNVSQSQSAVLGRAIAQLQKERERVMADIISRHDKGVISDKVKAKALQLTDEKYDKSIRTNCEILQKIEMSNGAVTY